MLLYRSLFSMLSRRIRVCAVDLSTYALSGRLDNSNGLANGFILNVVCADCKVCNQFGNDVFEVSHLTQDGSHQHISAIKNLVTDKIQTTRQCFHCCVLVGTGCHVAKCNLGAILGHRKHLPQILVVRLQNKRRILETDWDACCC